MAQLNEGQASRVLLLAVLILGGLGYIGYEHVYRPRAEEIAATGERVERLRMQNTAAREVTDNRGRSEVERRLALHREQLQQVEGLIPSSEELPDLLDLISAEAQRTGVDLSLIQPVGATAEQFYTRRTYELGVRGSYHQIAEFLTEVASLPRIVTPIGLNLSLREEAPEPGEDPQLEAAFSIETYVLPTAAAATDTADVE